MRTFLRKITGNKIDYYFNMPVQARAGIWFVICNILVKAIGFITVPLFTRIIPQNEYGDLSVYLSSTELVLILTCWDIAPGAYQRGLFKFDNVKFFTKVSQLFYVITTIIVFSGLYILYPFIGDMLSIPLSLYGYMFLYLLTQPAYRIWLSYKQKEYDYKSVVIVSLLYSLAVSIIPLVAVLLIERTADVKYITQMIISAVMFAPFFLKNINIIEILKEKKQTLTLLKFIIPFQFPCLINSLTLVILSQADRIMIKHYLGGTEAALYSVAYSIAFILTVVQNGVNSAMTPWRYELMRKKDYSELNRITDIVLIVIGGCVCAFILIAPELMKAIFSVDYYDAISCIPPLTLSIYYIFLYFTFIGIEGFFNDTKFVMYIAVLCCVINILLNYFAIKIWGYEACAYTTMVTYILFALFHYMAMTYLARKNSEPNILKMKRVIIISLVITAFVAVVALLYDYTYLRYGLLLVMCIIAFIKRKRMIEILHLLKRK